VATAPGSLQEAPENGLNMYFPPKCFVYLIADSEADLQKNQHNLKSIKMLLDVGEKFLTIHECLVFYLIIYSHFAA
jgi:hypothetical protein